MSRDGPRAGVLVAVVGPSGVGKDAVMAGAARHPMLDARVLFARRTVTRAAAPGAEDHDTLDEAGFARAEAGGAFALTWAAHGLRYGLPRSARDEVARGRVVVANLSRRALGDAAAVFGRLRVVEVAARPEVLLARLSARGREDAAAVRARLARQVPVAVPAGAEGHLLLDNSGPLDAAVAGLVGHLNGLCG
ncbi:phosphonate metabolism protein/1,5-bisphosphokinase (PRPP-forming) PhnN [Lichenibacterium dinghuense]|uniref:phosphonate metabolism protein/1,5-bisphosphokinase (PRPP-forming) PhnN n=1 Tax=Lichenibacterium dinghuense TaxID=2895977 RepID=UPI001F025325|nr:phosphonate metabolism protein/1,5-bisphosphokinase (PRPP-forming) PhnN [Lichenibacterium sp. 6Y81]